MFDKKEQHIAIFRGKEIWEIIHGLRMKTVLNC